MTTILKHKEVATALRAEIEAGRWRPGERLPGEVDLAQTFDVAHMTVRQAIACLVDEGLLVRIRGKGTFVLAEPAHQADRGERPLALLFPRDPQRADSYYFPDVLEGFQQQMKEAGRQVTTYSSEPGDIGRTLDPRSAAAFVLCDRAQVPLLESLLDAGHKILAVNRYPGRRVVPCVRIDDASGVERAVDHLVTLGHERIGFLCGPSTNLDAEDRLHGFRSAVRRHQLRGAREEPSGFSEATGYESTRNLLAQSTRPTAIVCASDLAAMGAIKAAREFGLSVPRGLSIVGFGDFSVADYILPSLTTVRQSRIALGKAAAENLIRLAGEEETTDVCLTADLIIRESTAPNALATQRTYQS